MASFKPRNKQRGLIVPTTFERKALYEEVWTTPLTHLGKKYGLSDNGVRKICKAMNIPLPSAGHWARIAAGHDVERPSLPDAAERTTYYSDPPKVGPTYRTEEDDVWLTEREAFERASANSISVELKPRKWHPAVVPLRDRHANAVKDVQKARAEAERYERMSLAQKRSTPNSGWRWKSFINNGQLLIDTHKAIPLKASISTYERALAIANALCWSAEERGFAVELNSDRGRIVLSGHGSGVDIRLAEKLDKEIVREKRWSETLENFERKKPTGVLRLYVSSRGSEVPIEESKKDPLESQLNNVLIRVYRQVIRCREFARESEERERRWEEEKRIRQEAERRRAEKERVRQEERRRKDALIAEALQWKQSTVLREYLRHIERVALEKKPVEPMAGKISEWLQWAASVANELDPTAQRI